jgi:Uma2 family endonuclease
MIVNAGPSSSSDVVLSLVDRLHRFSVEDYHRLGEHGILTPEDRVEFLEGGVVKKMTMDPAHARVVRALMRLLPALIPAESGMVQSQLPLQLSQSEPEPDVAVIRGNEHQFDHRHPQGDETALVVEVPDSSLAADRGPKQTMYARDRVPVYWIVNLVDRVVEVYTDPSEEEPAHYRSLQVYAAGQDVVVRLDGVDVGVIAVLELLPLPLP